MRSSPVLLRNLLVETKDGEWGKGEPFDGSVEMAVIRGTDFDMAKQSQLSGVPVRHIPGRAAGRKTLKPFDILIETAGGSKGKPTGKTTLLRPALFERSDLPITCASFARFLRIDPSLADPEFVYWYLQNLYFIGVIENYQIQHTGIARFQFTKFSDSIEIELPPIGDQKQIAAFFGSIDDRITLLRETNATLEAIAQTLFKSWFVDFDPVRARAEGRQPEGMDAATAALFPDSIEESELGLVPKGWRIGSLNDWSALNPESWSAKNHPETVAYVDLANAKENIIGEITEYNFDEAPSRARRVLRNGDTIVGTVRPGNRSFAFIRYASANLTGSTGFAVLRPIKKESAEFVYFTVTADSSIEYFTHVADGGAYPAVRPEVIISLPCVVPDIGVLGAFHEMVEPIFAKVADNHQQAQTLTHLRDTLLPRLISGQLRLPEAEALVEEACA